MTKVRGTGESIQMDEDWFVRRDGSMFPVSYTSTPIDMPDGPGVVVAFKDIEEQWAAEQALREREAILAKVGQPVLGHRPGGLLPLRQSGGARRARLRRGLRPRGPPRPRPRPLQVPRRHAVPRGRLPARPGPEGGEDAPGHRRLARAQGRLDRARHLLVGALRAAGRSRFRDGLHGRRGAAARRGGGPRARYRRGANGRAARRAPAHHRGSGRGARAARARPARRRAAAVRQRAAATAPGRAQGILGSAAGPRAARAGHRAGQRRSHRAAPPRGRDPSGDPHRPRARPGGAIARLPAARSPSRS